MIPTRADDDRLLAYLRLRARNKPSYVIAEMFGMSISHVDISCRKVLEADLNESGEPADVVKRAYWKQRAPRRVAK